MMTDLDSSHIYKTIQALKTGRHGAFMAHIADAYLVADAINKAKLLQAFGDTFERIERDIRRNERIQARLSGN
jgi:hypothetical protein